MMVSLHLELTPLHMGKHALAYSENTWTVFYLCGASRAFYGHTLTFHTHIELFHHTTETRHFHDPKDCPTFLLSVHNF
jgi:hypothetical protein